MTLDDYNLLGKGSFATRLGVLYEGAKAWCQQNGAYLHMSGLTKDLLGIDTMADYPVGSFGYRRNFN